MINNTAGATISPLGSSNAVCPPPRQESFVCRASRSLPVAMALAAAAPLAAQFDPDVWLSQCRRNRWNDDRPKYCEIRETGMRPARGALTVDPGQNGGVAILGWDKDSIAVTAKIEVQGYSDSEAADLAGRFGSTHRGPPFAPRAQRRRAAGVFGR